jgi:hypothetical protein
MSRSSLMPSFVSNTSTERLMHRMKYKKSSFDHRHVSHAIASARGFKLKSSKATQVGFILWGHSSTRPEVNSPTGPFASVFGRKLPYRSLLLQWLRTCYYGLRIQRITTRPKFCTRDPAHCTRNETNFRYNRITTLQRIRLCISQHKHQHISVIQPLSPFLPNRSFVIWEIA